ncbi:unnamed protein product [Trichobilharzia regenti]|nr:unnamed protein product [Trichobilharzia regenti]
MMPKNMTNQYEWPKPSTMPRTSLHLLVINCLTNLAQLNPFIFFTQLNVNQCCSNDQQFNLEQWQWPTAVDVILEFHNNSTDPQVQGQICILIGNLIGASLVWQSVNYSETNSTLNDEDASPHRSKQSNLERLFSQLEVYLNPSISGIAFRWALSGLRACSTSLIVHTSRHSYRLVRRELLNLIIELDWATISYLEETLKTCNFEKSVWFAVKPVRLIDLAWTECWRILCDADPDLREQASVGLIALCSNLTSGIGDYLGISTGDLLPNRVNRSLQFWFPQSYSQSKLGISCFGLVGCLGAYSLPPCLSTLPMEMDVGPVGQQFYQSKMSQLLHLEAENNSNNNYNNNNRTAKQMNCFHSNSTGAIRLFRNCLTALMELPCSSVLPEDRYMLLGVVSCLNQLIGFAHLLSYSDIWFDSSSPPPPSSSSSDSKPLIGDQMEHSVQSTQRRSRLSLLSWHCLTLLSSTPITSTDIELQSALLHLCTGCVIRECLY